MSFKRLFVLLAVLGLDLSLTALAQNVVSGDIVGTVTDKSGAVVPQAAVTAKSNATGASYSTSTSSTGLYHFPLLQPGTYTLTVTAPGMESATRQTGVQVGLVSTVNIQLGIQASKEVVEINSEAPLLQTENGNITTNITRQQIEELPNPGGDLTRYAQTAPGVEMNVGGFGFGNFSAFGLPATSNLFTVNGNDENDPFLNLNNSGSSNLTLGANEVQNVAVVSNGYTGQYGRQAGVQVDYGTLSGTNAFHGDAEYFWNGRALNANEWFNKAHELQAGTKNEAPFANAN